MNDNKTEAELPTERFFTVVYKLTDVNTAKYLSNRDWVTYVYADSMAEPRRLHSENETLRAKLNVYEDLGGAGSDVQLLRIGYAAARLEIESLKAQLHAGKQIIAAQSGRLAAYISDSALPGK